MADNAPENVRRLLSWQHLQALKDDLLREIYRSIVTALERPLQIRGPETFTERLKGLL